MPTICGTPVKGSVFEAILTRLTVDKTGTLRLDGRKYYSAGALTLQWIPVFALDPDNNLVVVFVRRDAERVDVTTDWYAMGTAGHRVGSSAGAMRRATPPPALSRRFRGLRGRRHWRRVVACPSVGSGRRQVACGRGVTPRPPTQHQSRVRA